MKLRLNFLICFYVLFIVFACTPVRNTTFRKDKSKENSENSLAETEKYKPRFVDTTLIMLPDVVPAKISSTNEYADIFKSAIEDFDNHKYESASQKFTSIKNTVSEEDSLYFESEFYLIECVIADNKLDEAKKRLDMLLADTRINDSVLERVLVRLGQIHCTKNDKKNAMVYFSRLEEINPNSIYVKVANCDFLKNGVK